MAEHKIKEDKQTIIDRVTYGKKAEPDPEELANTVTCPCQDVKKALTETRAITRLELMMSSATSRKDYIAIDELITLFKSQCGKLAKIQELHNPITSISWCVCENCIKTREILKGKS